MKTLRCGVWMTGKVMALLVLTACALGAWRPAHALTITVRSTDATVPFTGGYRYTIEEDATFHVVPDVTGLTGDPVSDPTLALAFHTSHTKVVKVGHSASPSVSWDPPNGDTGKRYYVSVMPDNTSFGDAVPTGFTMSGAPIRAANGAFPAEVLVPVNRLPFKTAQVSVFVFEDDFPINGAADAPGEQEHALCGWEVQIFEAGGTYGASGGRVSVDAFGNPLGTEYNGVDANGVPIISKLGANQLWTDRNGVLRIKNLAPAKYTLFSVAPPVMPSVARCNFADANGQPTNVPIWVANEGLRTRPDQVAWDNGYEIKPSLQGQDQSKWHQTTTIEGTWGVDVWVKSGEPTFFKEFGPPGHHVWHGFVRRFKNTDALNGPATVTGKVVNTHMSRPPGIRFETGAPMSACWIGISEVVPGVGMGRSVYANACDDRSGHDGEFSISGLRAGARYQLNVWDEPLDNVIANYEFSVPADGSSVALNNVPVFSWFSNLQGRVFYDKEGTGFPISATGELKPGIPQAIVNLRFRDGSIYNSTVTDDEGRYEFAEVFPFFNWQVAETDFTRFKATGATIIADNGGAVVDANGNLRGTKPDGTKEGLWPDATLTPQIQPETGLPYRIFGGLDSGLVPGGNPVAPSSANLLQAFQGFLGQTNVIHWGKAEYNPADSRDHGGITGVVHYASTRSEFDPKFATPENNEPGVPSVEIRLYRLNDLNQVVSPSRGIISPAEANEQDAVQVVVSDNWNKSQPESCHDPVPYTDRTGHSFATGASRSRCYDGMRVWNQVRDGVFDGGWAFVDHCPGGVTVNRDANNEYAGTTCLGGDPQPLPPGRYMTEGVTPYGYEHQKEEDKNVDFGDLLVPGTLSNPAECLGSRDEARDGEGNLYTDLLGGPNLVPQFLTQFDGVEIPPRFRDLDLGGGNYVRRPYCNKKLVVLAPGMNPFSDFHMFAKAPVAGHIVGMILDDLANEFDPYSPSFGEKYAPPFMPISIRDYAGNEINRVYSDRYGTYNALVPSTFAYNVPLPSGVAPNMVNVCLNSPTMKDPADPSKTIIDPHYNPQYTQYCYTFQYLPGKTTYLDTPVLPIAAFAGPSQFALDTEQPDATPGIKMVTNGDGTGGPWLPAGGGTIRIHSQGLTRVNNPLYDQNDLGNPANVAAKTIERNYGFGTGVGQVVIGGTVIAPANVTWGDGMIVVNVPAGVSGQVDVVAANGRRSPRGVTLHVGGPAPIQVGESRAVKSIQQAIDNANDGDLVLVDPGLYEEAPIVWKRVRVQGYGAPATLVNASMGAEPIRQAAWRELVCQLVLNRGMATALLPGQALPANLDACRTGDTQDNAPLLFAEEDGSGFFVLQKPQATPAAQGLAGLQIDGFTITGADTGGGIVANGHAAQLQISNNRIAGNQGLYNGGIRIGHADLIAANDLPVDSGNVLVNIHHNEILKNGNTAGDTAGGGGGISIYTGAHGYRVADNYVAGNFSTGHGGGMAHYGRSSTFTVEGAAPATLVEQDNRSVSGSTVSYAATVSGNQFRFNQSFSQAKSVQGGGLALVGIIDPAQTNGVTLGTGNVTVLNNVFQGNLAGAGDGGGIALVGVNGSTDVTSGTVASWNRVDLLNNLVVNNGAGVAGGGISLQDAVNVNIVNNTVSMNDSFATASRAFQGANSPTAAQECRSNPTPGCLLISQSTIQNGAGIAAYGHSPGLLNQLATLPAAQRALVGAKPAAFSDAQVINSVVEGNRRFFWRIDYTVDPTTCSYSATAPCFSLSAAQPLGDAGNDVAVLFAPGGQMSTSYSTFSALNAADGTQGGAFNRQGDATLPGVDFASAYALAQNNLKQLVLSLEQSVVKGAPVLEVQEPTPATTAAAFDEGGNFIDVRFGPLTRGALVSGLWVDFGTYAPTSAATAPVVGNFSQGLPTVAGSVSPRLSTDLNGVPRNAANWVRGALVQ